MKRFFNFLLSECRSRAKPDTHRKQFDEVQLNFDSNLSIGNVTK